MTEREFTPALGRFAPTRFYDLVASITRERVWRGLVLAHVAARPGDTVVDVGCGTGSLALLLHRAQPEARIIGVDPDPEVLDRARQKDLGARRRGDPHDGAPPAGDTSVDWRPGMGDALAEVVSPGSADVMVSSLVLHQCPMAMKRAILGAMHEALRPGGRLVIADYGLQRTRAMRLAFRLVQLADGKPDTQPNADGLLSTLIAEAGFRNVREVEVVPTITGSISIYTAHRD